MCVCGGRFIFYFLEDDCPCSSLSLTESTEVCKICSLDRYMWLLNAPFPFSHTVFLSTPCHTLMVNLMFWNLRTREWSLQLGISAQRSLFQHWGVLVIPFTLHTCFVLTTCPSSCCAPDRTPPLFIFFLSNLSHHCHHYGEVLNMAGLLFYAVSGKLLFHLWTSAPSGSTRAACSWIRTFH